MGVVGQIVRLAYVALAGRAILPAWYHAFSLEQIQMRLAKKLESLLGPYSSQISLMVFGSVSESTIFHSRSKSRSRER